MGQRKQKRHVSSGDTGKSQPLDSFAQQVGEALKQFNDPAELGRDSPLASVYVLGQRLRAQQLAAHALDRGKALQHVLVESAVDLADTNDPRRGEAEHLCAQYAHASDQQRAWYHQQVLDYLRTGNRTQRLLYWSFFHEPTFATLEPILDSDKLNIPRATYYRQLPKAVSLLAQALIERMHPALRLEAPPAFISLVGREHYIPSCLHALAKRQTVTLTGAGGVGKTAFGAALVTHFQDVPTFWFTIRPGLNDQLGTLLFELAAFLHKQGMPDLWLELMSDTTKPTLSHPTALLCADLASLQTPPLLCFDEVDLLRPAEREAHSQILTLLESLRGIAPMVMIGQQLTLTSDLPVTLSGLTIDEIGMLLDAMGRKQNPEIAQLLHKHTAGNPRLIHLLIALYDSPLVLGEELHDFESTPSTEALLDRIRRRLSDDERTLLMHLAVFRRAAPRDAWEKTPPDRTWHEQTLASLIARRLVQEDQAGGVAILPVFRATLYASLTADVKQALHLKAAEVRAVRGQYTAAAFHYLRAGQLHVAINLWHRQSVQEINQGQAHSALVLFSEVARTQLSTQRDQEVLRLILATLRKLIGDYPGAQAELQAQSWHTRSLHLLAQRLAGDIAELTNQFDQAITAYEEGITTIQTALEIEGIHLRKGLSRVYMRQQNLERAWHEAQIAYYEVENIQGNIEELGGKYATARQHYENALVVATSLGHTQGEAKTRNNVAGVLARLELFELAQQH